MSSTSSLTDRQKDELHKSLLDYFQTRGFPATFEALQKESGQDGFVSDPKAKYAGLLERKWTSVIRMQKKIIELEQKNAQLTEELASAPSARRGASLNDWVPRNPSRHTLTGHRAVVTRAAFHPVFSQVATSSEDSTIKIWDWETGEFERTLKGHTKAVQDVDFDSQGTLLASCSSDLTIKVWDTVNDWKNTKTFHGHDHSVSAVGFLPGDDYLISASRDRTIRIWELATGYCSKTLAGHSDWVRWVTPSADGRLIASCSNDQTCRIWDRSSGETKVELRGHEHVVEVVVFAPVSAYPSIRALSSDYKSTSKPDLSPGQFVASGGRDKVIKIWDTSTGTCIRTLVGHDNWIRGIVFSPNGKYLLSCSDDKTVRIWDLQNSARCSKTIDAHDHFITSISWAKNKVDSTAPRQDTSSPQGKNAVNGLNSGGVGGEGKTVNAVVTTCVDYSVKVWAP
ncbi:unnamed protein product [Sympodiomycopsis kandeliae]